MLFNTDLFALSVDLQVLVCLKFRCNLHGSCDLFWDHIFSFFSVIALDRVDESSLPVGFCLNLSFLDVCSYEVLQSPLFSCLESQAHQTFNLEFFVFFTVSVLRRHIALLNPLS